MSEIAPQRDLARMLLEYRDPLFAYILGVVRDWADAEELFQEVSLVILRKAQEGLEVENFQAWSREIAKRTALAFWKARRKNRRILSEEALDSLSAAFEGGNDPDLLARLRFCLEHLPAHLRRIVDLRYRKELSLEAIGRRIGSSAGAAQVALSRIRVRLADCVKRAQAQGS